MEKIRYKLTVVGPGLWGGVRTERLNVYASRFPRVGEVIKIKRKNLNQVSFSEIEEDYLTEGMERYEITARIGELIPGMHEKFGVRRRAWGVRVIS